MLGTIFFLFNAIIFLFVGVNKSWSSICLRIRFRNYRFICLHYVFINCLRIFLNISFIFIWYIILYFIRNCILFYLLHMTLSIKFKKMTSYNNFLIFFQFKRVWSVWKSLSISRLKLFLILFFHYLYLRFINYLCFCLLHFIFLFWNKWNYSNRWLLRLSTNSIEMIVNKVSYFEFKKVEASERMIDDEPHVNNGQDCYKPNLTPPIHILSCFIIDPICKEH